MRIALIVGILACGLAGLVMAADPSTQDPAVSETVQQIESLLPEYEQFCDRAEKQLSPLLKGATGATLQAVDSALLRIDVIRSIRSMTRQGVDYIAIRGKVQSMAQVDPITMLPKWKAAVEYYTDCARRGKDPFDGAFCGVRTVRSKMDGELLFYRFSVPADFDRAKKYPLEIRLHSSGGCMWRAIWVDGTPGLERKDHNRWSSSLWPEQCITVVGTGRGQGMYMGIAESALLEIIDDIKSYFPIDQDRVVIGGGSMGGVGGFRMGTLHPDMFSAVYSNCGVQTIPENTFFTSNALLKNLCNVSFGGMDGGKDAFSKTTALAYAEIRKMQEQFPEHYPLKTVFAPEAQHGGVPVAVADEVHHWLAQQKRNPWPKLVIYKTFSLRYDGAYWAHIDVMKDPSQPANIRAQIGTNNAVSVEAENIERFRLNLASELTGPVPQLEMTINGDAPFQVKTGGEVCFAQSNGHWSVADQRLPSGLAKTHGISGPIADAFLDNPALMVYGTADGSNAEAGNRLVDGIVRYWFGPREGGPTPMHTSFERRADHDVTDADISERNLILIGTPKQNAFLAKIADKLPVSYLDDGVEIAGKAYRGADTGVLMIYPNPLNPNRYVLLMPAWIGAATGKSYSSTSNKLYEYGDYVVCRLAKVGDYGTTVIQPIEQENQFFDNRWQITKSTR